MPSRLITAIDYARREGAHTVRDRIKARSINLSNRNLLLSPFRDTKPVTPEIHAEIDFGQWIAQCECGGAESVDPDEPLFYCFSCGNSITNGKPRVVVFPDQQIIDEIEKLLLERPVTNTRGGDKIDQAFRSKPVIVTLPDGSTRPLSRSWKPTETPADLQDQNKHLYKEIIRGL